MIKFPFRPNITANGFNIYFSNVCFNLAKNFTYDNDFNPIIICKFTTELEKTNKCAVVSIELKKAYDSLNHNILIDKL